MKYKLINKTTQEEHLCSKVVIDGFDYYMNDEKILNKDYCIHPTTLNISQHSFDNNLRLYWKKITATNNSNIDLPKVVDEVEEVSYIHYQSNQHYTTRDAYHFRIGYNKSQETHSFSENDMIEFNEFSVGLLHKEINGVKYYDYDAAWITTKELLQIWKEQQIKIVYYE